MEAARGYYCLIQYCPDPSRAEAATIGVVLFCPDRHFIGAKIAASNDRVRRFFGRKSFDPKRLNVQKRSFGSRIRQHAEQFNTLEDLQLFIATRANELVLTSPRPMKVLDPQRELDDLFAELVGGRASREKRRPVLPELDQALHEERFRNKVRFNVPISVPITGTEISFPYAYQNGTLNLIKPQRFSEDPKEAFNTALQRAAQGNLLYLHSDGAPGKRKLVLVASFPSPDSDDLAKRVSGIFSDHNVRMVPQSRIQDLLHEIEEQAHPFPDQSDLASYR